MREVLGEASPLADAVFALQGLGTTPILLGGSPAQKDRWLGPIAEGKVMTAFAMTEPGAGSDVGRDRHRRPARRIGVRPRMGAKTLISNAGIADLYVVFASTDPAKGSKGISCFLVPADTPGLRFAGAQVMSAAHPLGELAFERLPGPRRRAARRGGPRLRARPRRARPAAPDRRRRGLRHGRSRARRGAGAREAAAPVRRAAGQFQLVQQKLARMATDLMAARLLTYRAAYEKDQGQERITSEAAMAKSFATEMAQRAVDDAVQLIGGRGVLADHPVDRLYRAVRALRIYEGTTEIQQLIIAGELLKQS